MSPVLSVAALLAVGLGIYLVVALVAPERFS